MANYRNDFADVNLETGTICRNFMNHSIGSGDALGDRFGVRVFRNGEPVSLGGTCAGYFVRNTTGETVVISSGVVSGNEAYITLPAACYAVEGSFTLAIKVTSGSETVTMRIIDGVVSRTNTSVTVDPGTLVPSIETLISAINSAVGQIPVNYNASFAPAYSASSTYAVGDYVVYDGYLWRCTTAITETESWTAAHWTKVALASDVSDLKSALSQTQNNLIGYSNKTSASKSITGLYDTLTNGFYKVSTGEFQSDVSYRTYEYNLPTGRNSYVLSIYQKADGGSDNIYYVYMALDAAGNIIDNVKQKTTNQTLTINVPLNAVKIIYTKANLNSNTCFMTWKTNAFEHINVLERNIAVFVGDSYVGGASLGADQDKRFSTVLSARMGWVEKNFAVGGMGYIYGETTFEDQIDNAVADTSYDHENVRYVIIGGGRNDGGAYPYMDATLTAAVQSAITAAKTGFPNATIIVIPMMWDYSYVSRPIYPLYQTIIYAAQTLDAVVIPNAYTWLTGMKGLILSDNVHPNVEGHKILASHIENALITGYSFAYPASRSLLANSNNVNTGATNYFTLTQENGLLRFDAEFTLPADVANNQILFSLTVADTSNVPAYVGSNGRPIMVQKSDGTIKSAIVSCTISNDGGYTITAKSFGTLTAGTYYIDDEFMQFGLERYASWRN